MTNKIHTRLIPLQGLQDSTLVVVSGRYTYPILHVKTDKTSWNDDDSVCFVVSCCSVQINIEQLGQAAHKQINTHVDDETEDGNGLSR